MDIMKIRVSILFILKSTQTIWNMLLSNNLKNETMSKKEKNNCKSL